MKKHIYIILAMAFSWSCNEDFLERYPLDELSPQEFFRNASDLKLYANRFYTLLPAHGGYGGGTFWIDENSDNLVPGVFNTRLGGTRTVPASGGGWDWENIRQCNYFLDHCFENIEDTTEMKVYVGEVMFFKAMLYFDKVKTFGDVPWYNEAFGTNSPALFAPRDSRKSVIDSVIVCLDYAIRNLKSIREAEPFRINKETAMLLKARICLYEGTWEKYHQGTPFGVPGENGSRFIEMAASTAKALMETGNFSLYKGPAGTEYWSLFNQLDYTGNPEVLLWKKYDVSLGILHHISAMLVSGAGNMGISKGMADSYLCTDGSPVSVSPLFLGYDSIEGSIMNRDPRMAQSTFQKGYYQTVNSPGGQADTRFEKPAIDLAGQFRATTGYCLYKGVNPEASQLTSAGGWMGSIIMRYTEALLIYAEAKAELGTITQGDLDITINLIRDRVGMPHLDMNNIAIDPAWDFPSLSPIINEIRRERRVELAFEGLRWDDLARWRAHHLIVGKRPRGCKYIGSNLENTYTDYLGNPSIILGQNLHVDEEGFIDPYRPVLPNGFGFDPGRDYLSPIPSNELTLNSNLVQNPGW